MSVNGYANECLCCCRWSVCWKERHNNGPGPPEYRPGRRCSGLMLEVALKRSLSVRRRVFLVGGTRLTTPF